MRKVILGAAVGMAAAGAWWVSLNPSTQYVAVVRDLPTPEILTEHCADAIGEPRVEQVGDDVFVAIGYDLANTTAIRTSDGLVVIDPGMSPARAMPVRDALSAVVSGPIRAVVYTHSHIDHVGGASVWLDEGTEIWASDSFTDHFLKQYGAFRPLESQRGARQFGAFLEEGVMPCSALGRPIDLVAALETGVRLPTRTFSDSVAFTVGDTKIELVEAHGETHDQLFVWLPEDRILLPGDNYYRTFPNLYTIRGTSPRPVDAWIASLDAMRARDPEHLVPSHTVPVRGRDAVREALTTYRDGIQWVRDRTVQAANRGASVDELAAEAGLPEHLADAPALAPLYGQPDWSARAIYSNHIGWFDGRAEALYPLDPGDLASRSLDAMGGRDAVWAQIEGADPRWALHLLSVLERSGEDAAPGGRWALARAAALEDLAGTVGNTNGRAYLLETAREHRGGSSELPPPTPSGALVDGIPVRLIFDQMVYRLFPERSLDTVESVRFDFADSEAVTMTVRHGVAEVIYGDPLPGTPEPIATVKTDTGTWKRVALRVTSPLEALTSGDLAIDGDRQAFLTFLRRFRQGV